MVYWVSLITCLSCLLPAYHFEIGPIQYVRISHLSFVSAWQKPKLQDFVCISYISCTIMEYCHVDPSCVRYLSARY